MAFPDDLKVGELTRLQRCKVAFSCHVARMITDADGVLDISEVELLMTVFNNELMSAAGFIDDSGALSAEFFVALMDAKRVLPEVLSEADKLELVTLFHETVVADGETSPEEVAILREAAATLQIPSDVLDAHLAGLG
ncbi:MAG: hypothetical protein HN348_05745 [Proteobacteria bacterium]|jgi:uncharacterized tellurite resistance protein B-like protein|nr:hypothetical protein [Pseudomonadota bacterium]